MKNAIIIDGFLGTIIPARRWEHVVDYDYDVGYEYDGSIVADNWEDFDTQLFQTWDNKYYEIYPRLRNQLFFDDQIIIDEHRFMAPVRLRRPDLVYEIHGHYGPEPLPRLNNKKKMLRRWRVNTMIRKGMYYNHKLRTEKYIPDTLDDLPF